MMLPVKNIRDRFDLPDVREYRKTLGTDLIGNRAL
jgi:hypothetical protein